MIGVFEYWGRNNVLILIEVSSGKVLCSGTYFNGAAHEVGTPDVPLDLLVEALRILGEVKGLRDSARKVFQCLRRLAPLQSLVPTIQSAQGRRFGTLVNFQSANF